MSLSSFPGGPFRYWKAALRSPEPSLLQAEQPQLSQPFLTAEVLQPSDHLCGPPLDPLQHVHVFLVLRAPELDAQLQTGSHHSRPEGQNPLPRPAGHTSFVWPQILSEISSWKYDSDQELEIQFFTEARYIGSRCLRSSVHVIHSGVNANLVCHTSYHLWLFNFHFFLFHTSKAMHK